MVLRQLLVGPLRNRSSAYEFPGAGRCCEGPGDPPPAAVCAAVHAFDVAVTIYGLIDRAVVLTALLLAARLTGDQRRQASSAAAQDTGCGAVARLQR